MFGMMKRMLAWFAVLSFFGVMGCTHNSTTRVNVPGMVSGHLTIDGRLDLPILGASGVPAATKADFDALSAKLDKLTKIAELKKLGDDG